MKKSQRIISVMLAAFMGLTMLFSTTAFAAPLPTSTGNLHVHKYLMNDVEKANDSSKGTEIKGNASDLTSIPASASPLAGITFDVYKVIIPNYTTDTIADFGNEWPIKFPESDEYLFDENDILLNYEGAVPTKLKSKGNVFDISAKVTDIVTNSIGLAVANDLPLGIYLVIEKEDPRVISPAPPFLVAVPMTNPDGNGWMQNVHVYPKNEDARITKEADKTVVALGEIVTFTVSTTIPADVAAAKQYEMWDILDSALDYVANGSLSAYNNLKVELLGAKPDGTMDETTAITLTNTTPGQYYGITLPSTGNNNKLTVTFTPAGFAALGQKGSNGKNLYKFVRYTFQTSVNEKINDKGHQVNYFSHLKPDLTSTELTDLTSKYQDAVTRELENQANWDYTNRFGEKKYRHSERPKIHTAAVIIDKVDTNTGAKLGGAEFHLASSKARAEAGQYLRRITMANGRLLVLDYNESKTVNGVTYTYANANEWVETTTMLGYAIFEGLRDYDDVKDASGKIIGKTYLEYWLVETQSPTGYNLLNAPVKATFTDKNSLQYNAATRTPNPAYTIDKLLIKNNKGFDLPKTGGLGTILFTAGGVALVGIAVFLFIAGMKKKKEKSEQA